MKVTPTGDKECVLEIEIEAENEMETFWLTKFVEQLAKEVKGRPIVNVSSPEGFCMSHGKDKDGKEMTGPINHEPIGTVMSEDGEAWASVNRITLKSWEDE